MFIKYMSDLHIDVNQEVFADILNPEHKETTLVLAGDICEVDGFKKLVALLQALCSTYKHVIYVFGNHEYYRGSITRAKEKLKEKLGDIPNLHILDRDTVTLDGVKFVGATLWTDLNKGNPMFLMTVGEAMNDYKVIRWGLKVSGEMDHYVRRLRPVDVLALHARDLKYIKDQVENHDGVEKLVVITHHAPCLYLLRDTKFAGHPLNPAYASHLEDFVAGSFIDLWIHGHTHHTMDNDFYGTRIVCNPRGYSKIDSPDFDPNAIIEL